MEVKTDIQELNQKFVTFTFKDGTEADEVDWRKYATDQTEGLIEAGYEEVEYSEVFTLDGGMWTGEINMTFEKEGKNAQ